MIRAALVEQLADAAGDCEAPVGSLWEQGANAWSSLAYVAVGVIVAVTVARRRTPPLTGLAFAAATALTGIGSVWFHGAASGTAHAVHDVGLLAAVGYLAGWDAGRLLGRSAAGALAGTVALPVVGALSWTVDRASTNALVGAALAVVVGADLLARLRRRPALGTPGLVALVVLAGAAWWAGRSDSPLCDPDSPLQAHAAWHVLSALALLAWYDRATVLDGRPVRVLRRGVDRTVRWLAWVVVRAFHRSVEVIGAPRLPRGPAVLVANHGNGFVDPALVAAVLRRIPRFVAKATLWDVVPARPLLALVGVLPVHRAVDGGDRAANERTFAASRAELAHGATIAIFPEGTTGDRSRLDTVRTGAARMALGGATAAPDLVVVPLGLAFESRIETRSRAVVIVGEPIHVGTWFASWRDADPSRAGVEPADLDRDAVRALTEEIRRSLESVSPEFASVDERELLRAAARVATVARARDRPESFGAIERVARGLARAPEDARRRVVDAYRTYATRLQLLRLHDDDVVPRRTSLARLAGAVAVMAVLGSFVVTAALVHLPALVIVTATTGLVRSTATKGTVRLLVGTVALLATWIVAGAVLADGLAAVLAGTAIAAGGALALAVWSPLRRVAARVRGMLRARERIALVPAALDERAALVAEIDAALASGQT